MSTEEEKCLVTEAHQQLDLCCESACEKDPVREYIKHLEKKAAFLDKMMKHIYAEKTGYYFICGEGGEHDQMGLPEMITVCPSYGLDGIQMYVKKGKYSAPGY